MRQKTALFVTVLVAILFTSSFLVIWTNLDGEDPEFLVGVQLGYGNVDDCKALVDKVKNYTNLFVISSAEIMLHEDYVNEVCDYIYDSGLSILLYFMMDPSANYDYNIQNWLVSAKQTYGDTFLGEYLCDESGGNQMHKGSPYFPYAENNTDAANRFITNTAYHIQDYLNVGGEEFTADFCLYWFDYKVGFDVVLAELAWNNSRPLNIGLCRGAANVQNRDWGAMLTWTYRHPPYLESGPELYEDLVLAYDNGAKYAVVFNHEEHAVYSGYGILADEHFVALEDFWSYMNENPDKHGSLYGEVVLVLPQDYGFGLGSPDDKVWGIWESDDYTKKLWEDVNILVAEQGSRLDIVYSDPEFNGKLENYYKDVIVWSFED